MPLRSVGLALLAGVLVSCCFPVLLFGVCVWAAGCVAARLVAAVQLFGVPAVFPASFVLSSWTLVVGLTSGFPWFMSCHVMLSCPCIPSPCFSGLGVCVDLLKRSKTCTVFGSRGHRPIVDTCANEAIPQWGKRRLITFVYLQNMSMVMKQCCGYLPFLSLESCCLEFAWNNHYHELGTERAISLIQVCVL